MGKIAFTTLAIMSILLVSLSAAIHLCMAQTGTQVSGIISQDTAWTISGSPYTLTGNALVYQGVTLSIQPGVIVNLGSYYIKVNGTLSSVGIPTDKIEFNGGQITFTTSSNGWNQQTNSGCLIENAIINQTSIYSDKSLKIDNSMVIGQTYNGGVYLDAISVDSSLVFNNTITGTVSGSNSLFSNNDIKGDITVQVISGIGSFRSESSVVSNNVITGSIHLGYFSMSGGVSGDSSQVFNNTVKGSITTVSGEGAPQIYNNTITDGGIGCTGYCSIFDNYIYGCQNGISLYTPRGFGGNLPCYATVRNNLIVNNTQGILIGLTSTFGPGTNVPTISGNTISGNSVGISLSESYYDSTPTIVNNNLQNNSNYSLYLSAPNNLNATSNWWGTANTLSINKSIYDFKNDFNLGTVTFVPFLTAPNPEAPSIQNSNPTAIPTPTLPAQTPLTTLSPSSNATSTVSPKISPSPSIPEFPSWIILTIISVVTLTALAYVKRMKKQK